MGHLLPPLLPWKVLEAPLNIYKKACAEYGHDPDIVYIRPVYIDDDEKVIREEVERAILNFLAFNASPVESIQSEEKKAELRAKGYGFYASGALESLTKLTYEQIVEQEIGFIGTPEKVLHQVENLQKKGGIGELAIVSNFGGIDHWKSIKTQQMFAKHIIPAFRRKPVAPPQTSGVPKDGLCGPSPKSRYKLGMATETISLPSSATFAPMSARRMLVFGGIALIAIGMIFGDIFAVFILHQNAGEQGAALSRAAQAVATKSLPV